MSNASIKCKSLTKRKEKKKQKKNLRRHITSQTTHKQHTDKDHSNINNKE